MRFGVISGNDAINARIYTALEHIHPDDAPKLVAKFRDHTTDKQSFHTFRELLVGSHLRANGLDARYECAVEGKTPDWTLLRDGVEPIELIDVTTIHQRYALDAEIGRALASGRIWSGWGGIPPEHVHGKIDAKAGAYAALAAHMQIAYTVFVHGEFTSFLDAGDIEEVVSGEQGVFETRPYLSGVGFFSHANGIDTYSYFENPNAARPSLALRTLDLRGAHAA
jgi:hypothetical protein